MQRDSIANTFIVAVSLCLVCATLVCLAAIGLRSFQAANVEFDRKRNILQVVGFSPEEIEQAGGVEELFQKRFETLVINLESGQESLSELESALDEAGKDFGDDVLNGYDQFWASKSKKPSISDPVTKSDDIVGIKYREKFSHVYILKTEDGKTDKYVFPVRSYGLWSMMKGYLAVEPDFQTVAGLTFYEQKETPGLGGEVENPQWKSQWPGKLIYKEGEVELKVVKGSGTTDYQIDGLSGATITSNGVSNMIQYWMGPKGFGPFIERQKSKNSTASLMKVGTTDG